MKGIYSITNTINGNVYIGMTNNLKRRWLEHKSPKNTLLKSNLIYKAIRKYGIENFEFNILESIEDESKLCEREIYWINTLNPKYNMNSGGRGNSGYYVSEETKEKLRNSGKKQWNEKSEEEKRKLIQNNLKGPALNHPVSEKTRKILAEINTGKKQSEFTKNKRSEKMKSSAIGNKNGNKKIISIKNGEIKIHESIIMASSETNVSIWGIIRVAKNRAKTTKGYIFKYLN